MSNKKEAKNIFTDVKDCTKDYTKKDIENGKAMSILSYIGILCLIPYFAEKNNKYVRFHAVQGLNVFLAWIIYYIAYYIVSMILIVIPILGWMLIAILSLGGLAFLALEIMGIVYACQDKAKELPLINKFKIIKK